MKKNLAIAAEVLFAVVFFILSLGGTVESALAQIGIVFVFSAVMILISYAFMKKINKNYAYFYPTIAISLTAFPLLIILMVISGGWAILGYGIIMGLIITGLMFTVPFYWILDAKPNNLRYKEDTNE